MIDNGSVSGWMLVFCAMREESCIGIRDKRACINGWNSNEADNEDDNTKIVVI